MQPALLIRYMPGLLQASPGIFFDTATGLGAILGTAAPNIFEIYATGLGALQSPVDVTVAGVAAKVLFSGQAPGFPGLNQVNVQLPDGIPSGLQPLSITTGGVRSNEVKIRIK